MTKFNTIDPTTGKIIKSYETLSDEQVDGKIELAHKTYDIWKDSSFSRRRELLQKVGKTLIDQRQNLASIMTTEMGKRINEGLAEIDKCALVCEYYAKNSKALLKNEIIKTEAKISYVKFDPMGVVLVIMPWNFPFWQVFRAAAPAIMAGNTVLLKHASSVPECAIAIENIFFNAGAPTGLFQNLPIAGSDTKRVIENPLVRLVSLTGSEEAGATVASIAGKAIKRTILELGGSDPFIIMPDADIEKVAQVASMARMIVSGQSCIAAKRFIVHQNVVNKFTELLKANFEAKIIGDPSDPKSDVGPLSSLSTLETIHNQVILSIKQGATLVTGGKRILREGYFYPPTILKDVKPNMVIAKEETFGPVVAILTVSSREEALSIANDSHFGLGSSVWTEDPTNIQFFTKKLQSGCVFINSMVKSDPRLPFGGTKFSGFGRELGSYGLKEFVNIKTVWID